MITGSVLTFEHQENGERYGYDKVIMLAGGVGYGTKRDCLKGTPQKGNKVVVVGGDNYRIGLGGGSVSSVDTGRYSSGIELNAVQRANPEMQKRANNLVRALCEEDVNPVVSIHDHGSAGHVNCLSELVEECGGLIDMSKLPIGDKTLSSKEIIANESQERMGLLIQEEHIEHVRKIAERERAPMYVVGETTGDAHFAFQQADGVRPFDLDVAQMFGHSPKTYMRDNTVERKYEDVTYDEAKLNEYVARVLRLEAVACKDWLTNKVDRSVTGKVARQQCQGEIQLPLSDCGVVALDYRGKRVSLPLSGMRRRPVCRPGRRFRAFGGRIVDQYRMGTVGRGVGQRVSLCQLDVAVPLSGRRRCPFVPRCTGFVRFLLCFGNQRAYRKRFLVHEPTVSRAARKSSLRVRSS